MNKKLELYEWPGSVLFFIMEAVQLTPYMPVLTTGEMINPPNITLGVTMSQSIGPVVAPPNVTVSSLGSVPQNINIQNLAGLQGVSVTNIQGLHSLQNVQVRGRIVCHPFIEPYFSACKRHNHNKHCNALCPV